MNITGNLSLMIATVVLFVDAVLLYVTVSAFIHRNSIIGIAIIVERKITNRYLVYDV